MPVPVGNEQMTKNAENKREKEKTSHWEAMKHKRIGFSAIIGNGISNFKNVHMH